MPIVLLRVDERLIHGQVIVGWGERLHMDRIMVVDDELSESDWEQEIYCLGVPPPVETTFVDVAGARRALPEWQQDPRRTVVLIRDVATLRRLAEGDLLAGLEVNLGGIHSAPQRTQVLPYLHLSEGEKRELRAMAEAGVVITARDLPGTRPVSLSELVDRH